MPRAGSIGTLRQGSSFLLSYSLHDLLLLVRSICCIAIQISTNLSTRNHPFVIYLKTKRHQGRVPLTFLQQSYASAHLYADWVYRLLCEMEELDIKIHDPFMGHLISIAASVHLERSICNNRSDSAWSKQKFNKCRSVVRTLAEYWPNMANLVGCVLLLSPW